MENLKHFSLGFKVRYLTIQYAWGAARIVPFVLRNKKLKERLELWRRTVQLENIVSYFTKEVRHIIEKYKDKKNPPGKIGNRVWVMWLQGGGGPIPPVVRKCREFLSQIDGIDPVLITYDNLEEYYTFTPAIRKAWDEGRISMQTFSDMVRMQLLKKYGGFWLDATILVIRKDFVTKHADLNYYSTVPSNDSHLYFPQYKWVMYCIGGVKDGLIFSFVTDCFEYFWNKYEENNFLYYLVDYFTDVGYRNIPAIKELVDNCPVDNKDSYLGFAISNEVPFDTKGMAETDFIQKLNWRYTDEQFDRIKDLTIEDFQ